MEVKRLDSGGIITLGWGMGREFLWGIGLSKGNGGVQLLLGQTTIES